MPNLPLCDWSSQLFNWRAPSLTDVAVLLLNQPIGHFDRVERVAKAYCGTVLGDEFAAMLKMRPPKESHNEI